MDSDFKTASICHALSSFRQDVRLVCLDNDMPRVHGMLLLLFLMVEFAIWSVLIAQEGASVTWLQIPLQNPEICRNFSAGTVGRDLILPLCSGCSPPRHCLKLQGHRAGRSLTLSAKKRLRFSSIRVRRCMNAFY